MNFPLFKKLELHPRTETITDMYITDKPTCRGCGMELIGSFNYAYMPKTKERAPDNQYGGFVCSESCDIKVCIEVEQSMPGCSDIRQRSQLSPFAKTRIAKNWPSKP